MKELSVGDRTYRLTASGHEGAWTAIAELVATGDRFGIECTGSTEDAAVERLSAWLAWQHEHSGALEALQLAERAYHRAIAGSAFGNPVGEPTAAELQRASLEQIESARVRLDAVRARRPE